MNHAQNSQRSRVFLLLILSFCLLLPLFSAGAQSAQDGLAIELSVEPDSLTAPGTVTVSARVSNAGNDEIDTPLSLYDPDGKPVNSFGDGGMLLRLAPGETYPWQGQYMVTQAQLDEGRLVYSLRYSTPDTAGAMIEHTLPASASLTYTGEKVDLKVNRTIAPEVVRRGKEVTVLYELVNQGNVKLTNIQVKENRLISTRTQTVAALDPGATAKVTFTKTNVTGDLTSSALVTYRKDGERKTEQITVQPVQVPLATPRLTYTLTADKTQVNIGETVTLTLEIKNAGNISYSNVTVTDPKLGDVFTSLQIGAGQTRELKKEVIVNETATYAFTLKLEDNTGTTQEEKVPELKVSAYTEGQMLRLNLTLSAQNETISSLPGDIRFDLTVTNDSNTTAKNILIRHAGTNIYTIRELAPGQSTVLTRDFRLSQAGKYQFTAVATDVQNNQVEFLSNPLSISYVAPTPAPTRKIIQTIPPVVTHSPVPAGYVPQGGQARDALFILTLALGVLFGLALILLGVSAVMRARSKAKSNAAYDTFETSVTRDYTAVPDETRQALDATGDGAAKAAESVADKVEMPHEKYLRSKPDAATPAEAPAVPEESAPPAETEGGAYRLTRDTQSEPAGDSTEEAGEAETRSRRSQRHKAPENGDAGG